jgi:hypothetical protein
MRTLLLLSFAIASINSFGKTSLHELFLIADKDKSAANELLSSTEKNKQQSNVWMAYYGVAKMMMANHVMNPYKKYAYFKEGKDILEQCITREKENTELRFLRYSIQLYAPGFLGYDNNLTSDREFIQKNIQKITNIELRQTIISLLSKHK